MKGKEWEGHWLRKCSRAERQWGWGMGDVGVEESDINNCHDGVEGERHGERMDDLNTYFT